VPENLPVRVVETRIQKMRKVLKLLATNAIVEKATGETVGQGDMKYNVFHKWAEMKDEVVMDILERSHKYGFELQKLCRANPSLKYSQAIQAMVDEQMEKEKKPLMIGRHRHVDRHAKHQMVFAEVVREVDCSLLP